MSISSNGYGPPSPRAVYYRLWPAAYPAAVCEAVTHELGSVALAPAHVQHGDGTSTIDARQRQAEHVFVEPAHWTGALVDHFARVANADSWQLDLTGLGTVSFIEYEVGSHFDWHVDVLAYDDRGGEERKLSVTINLSDPDDYDGGDLEFMNATANPVHLPPDVRAQGSVVVFPSTIAHRVTPVTRGVRRALVGWVYGPPLR